MSRNHNLDARMARLQENAPKRPATLAERALKILAIKYEERGWGPMPPSRTVEWMQDQLTKRQMQREQQGDDNG
jgi:hypothetical protein